MTVGNAAFEALVRPIPGLVAAGSYTTEATYQHHIVYLSADYTVALATGSTQALIGVLMNNPDTGQAAVVAGVGSIVKIKCAGAGISYGTKLTTDGSGQAIAVSSGTDTVIAIALAAATAGDFVVAYLCGGRTLAAS